MAIVVYLFDKAEWDREEVKKLSYKDCVQAMKERRCLMQNIVRLEDSVGEDDIELFENYIRVFDDARTLDMGCFIDTSTSGSGHSGRIIMTPDGFSIFGPSTTTASTTTAWTPAPEDV